jgi:Ca2+-binding EF-hand superfamily protein
VIVRKLELLVLGVSAVALCACGSAPRPRDQEPEFHPPRSILEAYDFNHDGTITRREMEQGLRADFAKADAKHTGCLDADEVRAVNQQRWEADQSTASPLVDFKGKGCVDFGEFAATARSLFEQMDRNGDGKIEPKELHPPPGQRRERDDD